MRDQHTTAVRILICDADETERLRTRQTLGASRLSNTLYTVDGGEALLDYLYQRGPFAGETGMAPRPGLILLALSATNRDGRDALRRIQTDPGLRQIPVVIVAASAREEAILRGEERAAKMFMTTPVTLPKLTAAMNSLDRYWLEIVEMSPPVA